jgi:2,4-dienoyl-CoA reductase-like NADH-dependent reductase (Old Yellow Enzyme family)
MPLDDVQRAIVEMLRAGALDPERVPASPGVTGAAIRNLARFGLVLGDITVLPAELHDPDAASSPALGRDLARRIALAPGVEIYLAGDEPAAPRPDATEVVSTDDADVVAVARQLAAPRTVGEVIAAHADDITPADVVTILDGLADAGLIVPVTSTDGS